MRCFLSHNKADKEVARSIGAHMTLTGLDVWFDEWEIQAGDSIPGRLNEGLSAFDAFILIWSTHANQSNWVRQELHTAIMRSNRGWIGQDHPLLARRNSLASPYRGSARS